MTDESKEKTYYICHSSRGRSTTFNGLSSWFDMRLGPTTIRLTDQRIFITMATVSIFEAKFSEIALMKIKPDFLNGANVEVFLHNGNGFIFSINKIDGFFESLREFKITNRRQ